MENTKIKPHIALVLTGGGARGAYQAGVLKYLSENVAEAHFETLVGTSSGSINIAAIASFGGDLKLAGGVIASLWSRLHIDQVFRVDFRSIFMIGLRWLYDITIGGLLGRPLAHSFVDTSPLRSLLQELYKPEVVRTAIENGKLKNVAVSATEVNTGYLVTFVQSKNPKSWQRARRRSKMAEITVDHIMASSAIPLIFPSTLINKRRYVDGCIRSTSPLGPASRLGAEKIFAIGVRRYYRKDVANNFDEELDRPEGEPNPAQLGALILNSLFSESLDSDADHLERLNTMIPEQSESSLGMKKIDLFVIRPSEDLGKMAQQFHDRLPGIVRFLLRGLGSERGESSDVLSYLLFVPEYATALVALGYKDAKAEEQRIRDFFKA